MNIHGELHQHIISLGYPITDCFIVHFRYLGHDLQFDWIHCSVISFPHSGYMVVPAGGGGTFIGGYIVKRLKMRCRGIIRFCMICAAISLLTTCVFLLDCPNMPMAGVTAPYLSGLTEEHRLDQYKQLYDIPSKLRLRNRLAMLILKFLSCNSGKTPKL